MDNLIELTNSHEVKFEVFSLEGELLTASVGADGKKMIHGVASSTTKDLHGDTITLSGLQDMEKSAVGLTVFLNHSYEIPKDVGGTITRAIIKQKGVDQEGEPNYQLEVDIEVEDENPAALQTHKYIQKGRKLGLSIGAMIPEGGAKRQKDGSYVIDHVLLLELSMVGIPANPKSWVDYAASALRGMVEKAKTTELGNPTLTLDGDTYRIEGSMKGLKIDLGSEPGTTVDVEAVEFRFEQVDGKTQVTEHIEIKDGGEEVDKILGAWDLSDPDDRLLAVATAGEDVITKATVWVTTRDGDEITIADTPPADASASTDPSITADVTPGVTESMCPTCGKGKSSTGCSDAYHKAAPEPDVLDAKVRIIEVDTDDQSSGDGQGASSSEPDDSLSAPAADLTASGEPLILEGLPEDELVKLSFAQLTQIAKRTTSKLVETQQQLDVEKAARIEAERQRDAVIETAGELIAKTATVIEKIANSPLPRKASIKATYEAAGIEGYYGEAMARALRG